MGDDLVGPAISALLVPPQAARLATLVGVDLDRLVLNVVGWNKLVLPDSDRVFLFPRSAAGVEWFDRETAAYQALARTGLAVLPQVLGRWHDPEIYPFPVRGGNPPARRGAGRTRGAARAAGPGHRLLA